MSNALTQLGSDLDIVAVLLADHRALRATLALVGEAAPEERGEHFARLVPMLVAHELAEEQVVYPAVRMVTDARAGTGRVRPMIGARVHEQSEAQRLLARLERTDPASLAFGLSFQRLSNDVRGHAAAEERDVVPLLESHRETLDRQGLGSRFEVAKRRAPTHPHPWLPSAPPANMVLAPLVARWDRWRDRSRRRGVTARP